MAKLTETATGAQVFKCRPHGDVAVLWRNTLASHVKPVCYEDDRIVCLEYAFGGVKVIFVGVYLPYNTTLNFDCCFLPR